MKTRISNAIMLAALCLLCAGWLLASPTGSVTGFVKDTSGAFMPGVKVTLTSTATNAALTATTDANGEFQFPQVAPATYSLVVEAKGFKKAVSTATVQVDQITHAEFSLEVGDGKHRVPARIHPTVDVGRVELGTSGGVERVVALVGILATCVEAGSRIAEDPVEVGGCGVEDLPLACQSQG